MRRFLILAYGLLCYLVFLGTFVYAMGFVAGIVVPTKLDGPLRTDLLAALAIDVGLLGLFAVQHSGMARRGFKRWWTKHVPVEIERSTYVLASSLALILLFWQWRPLGGTVWQVEGVLRSAVLTLYFGGWALVLVATFLIDHFDLFGLKQVWRAWQGRPYEPPRFRTPGPYRFVRHPLYVGWLVVFWAAPTMTGAHLLFAVATTGYILIAIQLEERDLVVYHGDQYAAYRKRVPMLVPRLSSRDEPSASQRTT